MNINQFKPMPGRVIVKKLPDETTTKSGIVLPKNTPINQRHEYVEVIKVGRNISDDMRQKIMVSAGDKCIVLGKGIYDTIPLDDSTYYIVQSADIVAIIE